MSNIMKECLFLSGMCLNQLMTSEEFFYWLRDVLPWMLLLILSRIDLLMWPKSFVAELINRHVSLLAKLSFL